MEFLRFYKIIWLYFFTILIINGESLINNYSINYIKNDPETINIVYRLKKKLGIKENDNQVDSKHFFNTIINGKHFGENYHISEKIKKYFERTGILLNEDKFMIDNSNENKEIVLIGKRSPYEIDNDILTHFEFNKNILENTFNEGFFILNLKNLKIPQNVDQKYYLQIYKKYYNEEYEDKLIINDSLNEFDNTENKRYKVFIPKDILMKLNNEKLSDFTVYSKVIVQKYDNNSIFDITLPLTIKSLHFIINDTTKRKRHSQNEECNPKKDKKSCCLKDKYINLHNFTELVNIAFPSIINVKQCLGSCILNDYQSLNSYLLDQLSNKTIERTKCCRPTKFETINFVLKKDNFTAFEIAVNDLIIKECECY